MGSVLWYVHPNKFKLVWVLVLARLKRVIVFLRLPRLELFVQVEASSAVASVLIDRLSSSSSSKLQAIEGKASVSLLLLVEAKSSDMSNEKTDETSEAGESILDRLTRLLLWVGATSRKASRASDAGVDVMVVKAVMV